MKNILGLVISCLYIGLIIVSAKFFEKYGKESSRKYIHIMLSNWWIIAMIFFDNWIWASILPFLFIIVNYLSYKKDLIGVMERENQDGLGTVYYAISLFLLAIFTFGIIHDTKIGLVSILIMGYADGLAGIIGRCIKSKQYKVGNTKKSLAGSFTMFIVTFVILCIFLIYNNATWGIGKAFVYSLLLMIIEGVSIKGIDNLTVPIGACLLLMI